jgi:hypothetical protein
MNSPLDSILPEITSLVRSLKPSPSWWIVRDGEPVDDDTFPTEAEARERLEDHRGPCEVSPVSVQLTVGATVDEDGASWGYQTGDNSFTGGAYGHTRWGIAYVTHESDPETVAAEILGEIDSQIHN